MKQKFKRKRLWVDTPFQARLLLRVLSYFVMYAVFVLHVGFAFEAMQHFAANVVPKALDELYFEFLGRQSTILITLLLVMPIMLYDMLKFSHRIAGPLFRCRKVMQEMAQGKAVEEFKPRKRDFMRELFAAFNELIREWNRRVGPEKNGQAEPATAKNTNGSPLQPQRVTT